MFKGFFLCVHWWNNVGISCNNLNGISYWLLSYHIFLNQERVCAVGAKSWTPPQGTSLTSGGWTQTVGSFAYSCTCQKALSSPLCRDHNWLLLGCRPCPWVMGTQIDLTLWTLGCQGGVHELKDYAPEQAHSFFFYLYSYVWYIIQYKCMHLCYRFGDIQG